jgi:hypothetical protein
MTESDIPLPLAWHQLPVANLEKEIYGPDIPEGIPGPPLFMVCLFPSLPDQMEEIIKELLAAGANVDKRGRIGSMWFTPLAVAARMGLVRVVELLLKNNADVHAHGRRILHLVARWGLHDRAGVFKVLLNHGADVHAKDGRGYTPLHSAVHGSSAANPWVRVHVARLLIHYGADVLARNNFGDTAEFMATRSGVHRVVELIQTEPARMEALRRAKCEAFAMGQLERLGAVSRVRALDPGVVRMVLDHL